MWSLKEFFDNTRMATPDEHAEALVLRYEFICKWNTFFPDCGDAASSIGDNYDEATDYLLTRNKKGKAVGVVRFVRHTERGYFMSQYVDPSPYLAAPKNTVEVSEIVTHRDYRNDPRLIGCLAAGMVKHLVEGGYAGAIAICVPRTHKMIESLGFTKTDQVFLCGWQEQATLFFTNDIPSVRRRLLELAPPTTRRLVENFLGART